MIDTEKRSIINPVNGNELITKAVIVDYLEQKSYNKLANICGITLQEAVNFSSDYNALATKIEGYEEIGEQGGLVEGKGELKDLLDNLTILAVDKDNFIKEFGHKAYMEKKNAEHESTAR